MGLDRKDFERMRKELEGFDKQRDSIIKKSRDILSNSKYAVYSIHRNEMHKARELLDSARSEIDSLRKSIKGIAEIESIGAFSDAVQEYVEAYTLFHFVKDSKLPSRRATGASTEDYLMGICDLTGELARRAVMLAAKKDYSEIERIKDIVDRINGEFLQFNFRNSELRKKYDSVKWNLKKIEDVAYDISIRGLK